MLVLACFLVVWTGHSISAQDAHKQKDGKKNGVNEKEMRKKAQADLEQRFPGVKDQPVTWDHSKSGANTAYFLVGDKEYMAEYDRNGTWSKTYEKKEWNGNVPATVRDGYNKKFKDREVKSYWELSESKDKGQNGYLFYYNDEGNNVRNFEMDREGNLTSEDQYNYPH